MSRFALIAALGGWVSGAWLLCRVRRPAPVAAAAGGVDPATLDGVAVVVPARDEAGSLPALLDSLARQRPAPERVVVVDDHSTDATAAVARTGGAEVVPAPDLPPGWTGKSWACWTGAAAVAPSEVIVFLDADTVLCADGLARVVSELRQRGGLVSVQPYHVPKRVSERLSAFFNLVAMMGVDAFAAWSRPGRATGAFGPVLACRRRDYLALGGHRAVRGEVVEDVALARLFAAAARPVTCFGGRDTVTFRMYPAGLRQLVDGWSKNIALGARATRWPTFALVFLWVSGCILAGWSLPAAPAGAFLYGAYAGQVGWMLRRVGRFGWWPAALYPAPLGFFLVVFARSLVLAFVVRRVRWRGRTVPVAGTSDR